MDYNLIVKTIQRLKIGMLILLSLKLHSEKCHSRDMTHILNIVDHFCCLISYIELITSISLLKIESVIGLPQKLVINCDSLVVFAVSLLTYTNPNTRRLNWTSNHNIKYPSNNAIHLKSFLVFVTWIKCEWEQFIKHDCLMSSNCSGL